MDNKVYSDFGEGKIPYISYEVHISARVNDEIWKMTEKFGIVYEHDDKRKHNNTKNKANRFMEDWVINLRKEGFNVENGIYEE